MQKPCLPAGRDDVDDKIREMVRRIVGRFRPAKIILFGSHATGTAGPDSDVDLLVVMDVDGSKRKKAVGSHRSATCPSSAPCRSIRLLWRPRTRASRS